VLCIWKSGAKYFKRRLNSTLAQAQAPTLLLRTQSESDDLKFFEMDSVIKLLGGDVFFTLYPSQAST
jgi:hypothetical protein